MVVFQSLAFVYCKESDTSIAITMNAFFVDMAIPFFQKSNGITTVICEIFIQAIIKSTDVGRLLDHVFYFTKFKFCKKTFCEIEKWHFQIL